MAARLQDTMKPMHITCQLRDLGLGKSQAIRLSRAYEWAILKGFRQRRKAVRRT
jgi:hypothetical protein